MRDLVAHRLGALADRAVERELDAGLQHDAVELARRELQVEVAIAIADRELRQVVAHDVRDVVDAEPRDGRARGDRDVDELDRGGALPRGDLEARERRVDVEAAADGIGMDDAVLEIEPRVERRAIELALEHAQLGERLVGFDAQRQRALRGERGDLGVGLRRRAIESRPGSTSTPSSDHGSDSFPPAVCTSTLRASTAASALWLLAAPEVAGGVATAPWSSFGSEGRVAACASLRVVTT